MMELSAHARKRCAQRGLPQEFIDRVMTWGWEERQRDGRSAFFIDAAAVDRAKRFGENLEPLRNALVVVSRDGNVVTVGRFPNLKKIRWRRKDGKYRSRRRQGL